MIGEAGKMLGVRPHYDIPVLPNGMVRPQTGGLSVVSEWRRLPLFLIPRRLQSEVEDARGNSRLICFRFGDLPFQESQVEECLALRPDSPEHGTIEPSREMLLDEFQEALASTRDLWVVDET